MLSLNDAPNYSTWFYLWRTQGGATQRSTPVYNGTPGYCVVHHITVTLDRCVKMLIVFIDKLQNDVC